MSSSSGSDSGGSSGSSSSFDYESEAYGTPDSINDFSVDEGGSGGDQEAYNDIMETYSPANNKLEAQETIRQQNIEELNLQDYETIAYQDIPTRAVPQFDKKGKFTGVKTIGDGVLKGNEYTSSTIQGVMLDSTLSDKKKIDTLNRLQAMANSPYDSGKPNVDDEAKAYMQDAIQVSLDSLKNDKFFDDLTSGIDLDSKTYNDTFKADPLGVYGKAIAKSAGKSLLTGGAINPLAVIPSMIFSSLSDAYGNKKALDVLGFDGKKLKPNYAEVGDRGGILTNKEYLLGNTLNSDEINNAIPNLNLPTNGGYFDNLPPSMVDQYYSNNSIGRPDNFNSNYESYKNAFQNNNINNNNYQMASSTGIFNNYLKERGLI